MRVRHAPGFGTPDSQAWLGCFLMRVWRVRSPEDGGCEWEWRVEGGGPDVLVRGAEGGLGGGLGWLLGGILHGHRFAGPFSRSQVGSRHALHTSLGSSGRELPCSQMREVVT